MAYLYLFLVLLGLWLINLVVAIKFKNSTDSELAKKTVHNGNGIFTCVVGIAGIAISSFLLDFVKWIVIAYYGIMFLIQAFQVISGFILQIIADIKEKRVGGEWWCVWLSNLLACFGYATIVIGCLAINFSLIKL